MASSNGSGRHGGGLTHCIRHCPRRDRDQRCAARIVEVHDARGAMRQHLEQTTLGGEVRLHVAMKVEVIARQVREHAGGERDGIRAAQRERVRRHFHHGGAAAVVHHLPQHLLHVRRLRCRSGRFDVRMSEAVDDGAEQPAPHAGGFEDRPQQVRCRGLPVRAGDADNLQQAARVALQSDRRAPPVRGARRAPPPMAPGSGSPARFPRPRPPRRARPPAARTARRPPSVRATPRTPCPA